MSTKIETFLQPFLKKDLSELRPGDSVRVFQKIPASVKPTTSKKAGKKEGIAKERLQVFEGLIIAIKHKKEIGATITVRREILGVGVERIFPLHLPTIEKIEVSKRGKVRRAKLYYLRKAKGKKARLKEKGFVRVAAEKKEVKELSAEESI